MPFIIFLCYAAVSQKSRELGSTEAVIRANYDREQQLKAGKRKVLYFYNSLQGFMPEVLMRGRGLGGSGFILQSGFEVPRGNVFGMCPYIEI